MKLSGSIEHNEGKGGVQYMQRTTKPVSELCWASQCDRLPLRVIDKDGDRFTVLRLTWIGRTCYCICSEIKWCLAARHVRYIETLDNWRAQ